MICRKLSVGQTSEEAAENLARRSGVAEIRQFAEVFSAAKRTSGQLAPILKDIAALLAQRQETEEEIRTMSAARLSWNFDHVSDARCHPALHDDRQFRIYGSSV